MPTRPTPCVPSSERTRLVGYRLTTEIKPPDRSVG